MVFPALRSTSLSISWIRSSVDSACSSVFSLPSDADPRSVIVTFRDDHPSFSLTRSRALKFSDRPASLRCSPTSFPLSFTSSPLLSVIPLIPETAARAAERIRIRRILRRFTGSLKKLVPLIPCTPLQRRSRGGFLHPDFLNINIRDPFCDP